MVRTSGKMAVLVIALTLAYSGSLMADLANPFPSQLKRVEGANTVFQDTLTATVTLQNSVYHYLYQLDFAQGYNGANLTEFSVGNLPGYITSATPRTTRTSPTRGGE